MALLVRFNAFYTRCYEKKPLLTLAFTNAVLGALSDILAQYFGGSTPLPPTIAATSFSVTSMIWLPDMWRLFRFVLYNFMIAPLIGKWFVFLDRQFPLPQPELSEKRAVVSSASRKKTLMINLMRVLADQLFMAPIGLLLFFIYMPLMEGKGMDGVCERISESYWTALQANYTVWPLVQFVNFCFMPLRYRVPFVSLVGVLWNGYLSWLNSK
ncbi:uncharacterized protein VTP21DRAFT_8858 [Calcarisporiella thermophila]|uniref:uncharacterized protein n=1 Tax=Calcarisporiella thermophila TaxID=911321 RepID=UPI003741EEC5